MWLPLVSSVLPKLHAWDAPNAAAKLRGWPTHQTHPELAACAQVVGRYSYRLQRGARLAPNQAGLDPLAAPAAFNAGLRAELEALFVPRPGQQQQRMQVLPAEAQQAPAASSSGFLHTAQAGAATAAGQGPEQEASRQARGHAQQQREAAASGACLPAEALSEHISAVIDPDRAALPAEAVPDLHALHRRMPALQARRAAAAVAVAAAMAAPAASTLVDRLARASAVCAPCMRPCSFAWLSKPQTPALTCSSCDQQGRRWCRRRRRGSSRHLDPAHGAAGQRRPAPGVHLPGMCLVPRYHVPVT